VWADGGWAYLNHETYKPMGWFLGELARARSWGGNFLPSVGPDAHGVLPEVVFKRFAQLKGWMEHHGEAVRGVQPGPWPERSNVPITTRGKTWYAHVDWVHDSAVELKGVASPRSVQLLRDGTALSWTLDQGVLRIDIPLDLRTTLVDVVRVEWESIPE
jgi:alpha-L-fucosidase